jgi:hypothetical protein
MNKCCVSDKCGDQFSKVLHHMRISQYRVSVRPHHHSIVVWLKNLSETINLKRTQVIRKAIFQDFIVVKTKRTSRLRHHSFVHCYQDLEKPAVSIFRVESRRPQCYRNQRFWFIICSLLPQNYEMLITDINITITPCKLK